MKRSPLYKISLTLAILTTVAFAASFASLDAALSRGSIGVLSLQAGVTMGLAVMNLMLWYVTWKGRQRSRQRGRHLETGQRSRQTPSKSMPKETARLFTDRVHRSAV